MCVMMSLFVQSHSGQRGVLVFVLCSARVYIVPDFFTFDLIQSRWRNVGQVPTLSIYDTPFYGVTTFVKLSSHRPPPLTTN